MTVEVPVDYMSIANRLKTEFAKLDTSNNGFITVNELRHMIQELDIYIPEDVLEEAIMAADVNEDGTNISFYEFIGALITDLDDEDEEGDLKRSFQLFANDANNVIQGRVNLLNALRASGRTLTANQVDMLLENYETRNADQFDFQEFEEIYNAAEDLL
jgi:Ca2+-binding EF-hand superfamily protein